MQMVPKGTEETLAIYLNYLTQHLEVPCQLTGIESRGCFDWEASYIFGRRRPKEYVQRKQHQPSYTDTYVCLSFEEECDIYAGLAVTVKRVSDSKRFVLPCAHLKTTEKPSNNAQLLDDYVIWFVNYRSCQWSEPCPKPFSLHPSRVIVDISRTSLSIPSES
jgi:hypothetical protein